MTTMPSNTPHSGLDRTTPRLKIARRRLVREVVLGVSALGILVWPASHVLWVSVQRWTRPQLPDESAADHGTSSFCGLWIVPGGVAARYIGTFRVGQTRKSVLLDTPANWYWTAGWTPHGQINVKRMPHAFEFAGFRGYRSIGGTGYFLWSDGSRPPSVNDDVFATVPFWPISLIGAVVVSIEVSRSIRIARLRKTHCCPSCGYDLRATPDRCPECGTPVAR